MDFLPSGTNASSLARYAELMNTCFPAAKKYGLEYLRWLYHNNPDGEVVGFDAFEGDRLVAHYACVPAMAHIDGSPAKVLLSLNTATHPEFQGQGLFSKLAERTFDAARIAGIEAVYGVANANSTPGFVRKLGFQLVTPLEARLGLGSLLGDGARAQPHLSFKRMRSAESMRWRCANPYKPLTMVRSNGVAQCFSPVLGTTLGAYHEFEVSEVPGVEFAQRRAPAVRLFLGLVPEGEISSLYRPIPGWLRPSPLNLIFRSLTGRVPAIDERRVSFSFIDFDAY